MVLEEKEFREIEKEEFDPEISVLSENMLAVWHKKQYRQFSYKSMFMLIQSVFENGLVGLHAHME